MFPIVLNLFEFTPEEHTLSIVATDSTQLFSSYQYTFFGRTSPGMFCIKTFILYGHEVRSSEIVHNLVFNVC